MSLANDPFANTAGSTQSNCYTGIADIQNYPLQNSEDIRFLETLVANNSTQVIVPDMQFSCMGYITSWSAHTSILTQMGFVDLLTHTVTFQVWRPDASGQSYSRVGSNQLEFRGNDLRSGITLIPGTNDTAFFSFQRDVAQEEQILVQPGDVVGWYIPYTLTVPPLSPLFRDRRSSDRENVVVDMMYRVVLQEDCVICGGGGGWDSVVVYDTVALVAPSLSKLVGGWTYGNDLAVKA